ncbi:TIGR01777 family oxidoreductase [Phycisphaerales bacterium AB-hyl4]|uniref:TIGR01777 family oxidoreductase n=1 Tax=Natronomicrosphaera hydrolytica TaxID=3242702 RepID=A0ABV4U1B3_9BACT
MIGTVYATARLCPGQARPEEGKILKQQTYVYRSRFEAPADRVFAWHTRPGAFERLTPPWERVQLVDRQGTIHDGDRTHLRVQTAGVWRDWIAEHRDYVESKQFRDVQVEGPMRRWEHTHLVEPVSDGACMLEDRITYELPMGQLGRLLAGRFTHDKLERMFRYRHAILAQDLAMQNRYATASPQTIAIAGSSGLIGSELVPLLSTAGHKVIRLVRREPKADNEVRWSPDEGHLDLAGLAGVDAVVNLAGESIVGRWTEAKKQRIRDSREKSTRLLAETISKLDPQPSVLVNASAIGFYGDRGDEMLDETSSPGEGFLSEACQAWEASAREAVDAGIRTVFARFGLVLSPKGGALANMLPIFRSGLAGQLGDGQQWWSWVAMDDVIGAVFHALFDESSDAPAGPMNVVSPNAVTNRTFTKTLGKVIRRPTIIPAPRFALHLAFGDMADDAMFASARVQPAVLERTGYEFAQPELEAALRHLLGR